MAFFTELGQKSLKFLCKHKRPQISKEILKKKKRTGGIRLSDFGLYYKTTVIKTVWYWHRNIDQWNMTESLEINPCTYVQLIYDKGVKHITIEKDKQLSLYEVVYRILLKKFSSEK